VSERSEDDDIPPHVLAALRSVCLALPETDEEQAWVGIRWAIRRKNFAHVLVVDAGWPPAYAKAIGSPGPACVLTFRTPDPEQYRQGGPGGRFFWPGWFPDLAGTVLDGHTDWTEIAELVTESYCVLAPKRLGALVVPRDL
jgi:YjbR